MVLRLFLKKNKIKEQLIYNVSASRQAIYIDNEMKERYSCDTDTIDHIITYTVLRTFRLKFCKILNKMSA